MAVKTWANGEALLEGDLNTYGVNHGMKLLAECAGSNSSILSGVFTSEFRNYRVVVDFMANISGSATSPIRVALRVGNTETTTNYSYVLQEVNSAGTTTTQRLTATSSWIVANVGAPGVSNYSNFSFDLYNPQRAAYTGISCRSSGVLAGPTFATQTMAGWQSTTTQFDGIRIGDFSWGNQYGVCRIYGYRDI